MKNCTYTSGEVADFCAVSKSTVIRWIKSGQLEAYATPGGHRRVPAHFLRRFMMRYKIPLPRDLRGSVTSEPVREARG